MEQTEQKTKGRKKMIFIIGALVTVIIVTGSIFLIRSNNFETTDNAQIDGNIAMIRSGVTAYLQSIRFTDNQQVHKGDTLIVFNTAELSAKTAQAAALLANAQASLGVSGIKAMSGREDAAASLQLATADQQSIAAAKANLTKAQQDLSRDQQLLQINAVTRQQYEADKTAAQIAAAEYEKAVSRQQSSVTSARGSQSQANAAYKQISVAQAVVSQREAELEMAREELSHAYVTAPFDGIVTKRMVQDKQYITTGQTLCAVIDTRNIWVSANFKETQLQRIRQGQPVTITVDAYPGVALKGHVSSFLGATGAKFSLLPPDNATGNFIKITQRFPLRIDLDDFLNAKNKPTVLFAGLNVVVKVKTN